MMSSISKAIAAFLFSSAALCAVSPVNTVREVEGVTVRLTLKGVKNQKLNRALPQTGLNEFEKHVVEPYATNDGKVNLEKDCTEEFFHKQKIDHFNHKDDRVWSQRFFICKPEYWKESKAQGPILFHAGGDLNVENSVRQTGIMWENAKELGGLMVFAEHRYFGKSHPVEATTNPTHPHFAHLRYQYLSTAQSLADYASLIHYIKNLVIHSPKTAVVAFGGSYGGMLSFWLRQKYPGSVDGAISSSAPLLGLLNYNDNVQDDKTAFYRVITQDVVKMSKNINNMDEMSCAKKLQYGFNLMEEYSKTEYGRHVLNANFRRCKDSYIESEKDVEALKMWLLEAVEKMAMSSYPYASSFLTNGKNTLPPYPLVSMCKALPEPEGQGQNVLAAMWTGIAKVYYDNGKDKVKCFSRKDTVESPFESTARDYLACTDVILPTEMNGKRDLFWKKYFKYTSTSNKCKSRFGVKPGYKATLIRYGGRKGIKATTNVVFTSGDMDPWSSMSVMEATNKNSLTMVLPNAGHQHDFMFSSPADSKAIVDGRRRIVDKIKQWDQEVKDLYKYSGDDTFMTRQASINKVSHFFD